MAENTITSPRPLRLPSYHMHTRWSDGAGSVRDMVAAAEAAGLLEIGISDHLIVSRQAGTLDVSFAMPRESLPDYAADIAAVRAEASIPVLQAVEVDWFPDTPSVIAEFLAGFQADYLVGSVHVVDGFPIDSDPRFWAPLGQREVDAIHRGYWRELAALARSGLFSFIGHLDLPKKFGFLPSCDLSADIREALDAIQGAALPVELNTAGWDKPCAEPYPAPDLLAECRRRGIPVVISDDAHAPGQVARHFARACECMATAGYSDCLRLRNGRGEPLPLPEANG